MKWSWSNFLFAAILTACATDYELKGREINVEPGVVTNCAFLPIVGTRLSKYECNPVFVGENLGSIGFHSTEIMGHPFYQVWYTTNGSGFGDFDFNYAASADGTTWEIHPNNPLLESESGTWDTDSIAGQVIEWNPIDSTYVMSYQGFSLNNFSDPSDDSWGLGIAYSPDGQHWEKHVNNPVIDFNAADYVVSDSEFWDISTGIAVTDKLKPCWPLTINRSEEGGFRGYIAASKWQDIIMQSSNDPGRCEVFRMSGSADASTWVIDRTESVLPAGSGSDEKGVMSAAVVKYNGVHHMFYVGFSGWGSSESGPAGLFTPLNLTLNLATSTDDGETWRKDSSNPLPIHLTDPGQITSVGAQLIGTRIHLWVGDTYEENPAIGYFYYEPDIEPHR